MEHVYNVLTHTLSVELKRAYLGLPILEFGHPGTKLSALMSTTLMWNKTKGLGLFWGLKWLFSHCPDLEAKKEAYPFKFGQ